MSPARRVYQMRWLTGLILALPFLLIALWYAWSAYASIDRYRRAAAPKQKITLELFQIALHDELTRDLRRLTLPSRPEPGALPTYELSLTRDNLDRLDQGGPTHEGEQSYVHALIKKGGEVHEARVRYRGGQPWHYLGAQKSMKIRIDRGELIDGARAFNLINDPTPFGLEDQLILDLARESGLLAPEYRPVRVRINNTDAGVYRYEAQPDEGLLRRNDRMPGNMYSGDSDHGDVFTSTRAWRKVAERSEDEKSDMRELERLLAAINNDTHEEFAAYAEKELDLDRYALFDALDVVFGGAEHDWSSNHKFYVDPYRGKLEPVAWSFRGFQHELKLNFVDHPLLIRLKMTPGYLARRDRAVYELLTQRASVPAIRARVNKAVEALAPELAADPWWDAYKLLPRVSRFLRFYPRPMSLDRWALAGEYELDGFAERSRYLLNVLEEPGIDVRAQKIGKTTTRIDLTLEGEAAYALRRATFPVPAKLYADADLDGVFDKSKDVALDGDAYRALAAGVRLVAREEPRPKTGSVRVESEPRTYTFFAESNAQTIESGSLELDNLVTGGSTTLSLIFTHTATAATPVPPARASDRPRFAAGERSPHAWDFAQPASPKTIALGPGVVRFEQTMRYGAQETVRIAEKTTIELGANVSLLFEGPVYAGGALSIVRADPYKPWGGIALQGPKTRGSRLDGVFLRGGTRVRGELIAYTGVLNIHDTRDITVEHLTIEDDADSDDVLHANAVDGLVLRDVSIARAPVDAIDLELTNADLTGISVVGAGDDCLDLGGAEVRVRDSVLVDCKNNGISAGEKSDVSVHGTLIAGASTALLAKNGSEARAVRSVFTRAEIALKTSYKELYYANKSAIGTSELYAPDCGALRDAARGTTIEAGSINTSLPDDTALRHLLVHVLHLSRWSELDAKLAELKRSGAR